MTRIRTSRHLHRLAVTAAFCLALPAAAMAQSTMKLASATINDVQHQWQKVFAAEMKERAGNAVTVELYPASQLGAIPRMTEGVLLGTIEAFTTPTSFVTGVDPRFQAFDVPGLFRSAQEVRSVIHDPEYRDHLETMFLNKGVRVIGAIYNSPMVMLTREPVETLADIKGLKIRTFASPLQMEPMKAIGARPTPMALSEVMPQLQSEGLNGMLAGMPILTAFKFHDVAEHVANLNFSHLVSLTLVNEAWFQAQAPETRDAIRAAGRAAEEEVFSWGVENVERANRTWREAGGKIHELPEDEQTRMMARFVEVGEEVIADQPDVVAEYERIKAMLDAERDQ